jgi:hypothetical protein
MVDYLRTFGLPEILQSITVNSELPMDVWSKIEEFQKKGAAQNFA